MIEETATPFEVAVSLHNERCGELLPSIAECLH